MMRPSLCYAFISLATCTLFSQAAYADVEFVTSADVTARSVRIAAQSTETIDDVVVEVFTDPDGLVPYGGASDILLSTSAADAHLNGLLLVQVGGLAPETSYFLRLVISGPSGPVSFPPGPPYYGVTTAAVPATLADVGQLAINEIAGFDPYIPNLVSNAGSVLVLLDVPSVSPSPVSAFVDTDAPIPVVVFDLNNIVTSSGGRAVLSPGQVALFTEMRGLNCAPKNSARFRRTVSSQAVGAPLQGQRLARCFATDTVCDDTINILDVQQVLNSFNTTGGDCGFNPDNDVVLDNTIDEQDLDEVINRFGDNAPFD